MGLVIRALGMAIHPSAICVSNEQLIERISAAQGSAVHEFTSDWYERRVGVLTRYFTPREGTGTTDMAELAAINAFLHLPSGVKFHVDEIIVATITPDKAGIPSTAHAVHERMRTRGLMDTIELAMDLNMGCCGFLAALLYANAAGCMHGRPRSFLLIGSERLSMMLNFADPVTAGVFGDGAGAALVEWLPDVKEGIQDTMMYASGNADILTTHEGCITMNGKAVFQFAVSKGSELITTILQRNGLSVRDISGFFLHQANDRIRRAIARQIGAPEALFFSNIARYGNTSAASIPICLTEAANAGLLIPGALVILEAFGAGLGAGALLLRI